VRGTVTRLLQDWQAGDGAAQQELFNIVERELKSLAGARLRGERRDHTLQPTALVNEVWLRMVGQEMPAWAARAQFFAVVARLMRQTLVDHARARMAQRRQAGVRVFVTGAMDAVAADDPLDRNVELIALHDALDRLVAFDERRARVLELRYFGGLERGEIAEVLGVTERTVKRDLVIACAWLKRELAEREGENESESESESESEGD
jgi:RNA polymerase sigma factor (TIGR02999 family)